MTIDKGILIKNIFYMLSYAFQELKKNTYEKIAGEKFENIYDLFAEILGHGISSQLKQGLHRNYVPREDELNTLRGKLNMPSTMRLYARGVHRLDCEFDEYSENNVFNRILKTTMLLLIKHHGVQAERKQMLRKMLPFFTNVDDINLQYIKWNTFRFDRNSKTYEMLMYLCYFIIDNMLLSTESGDYIMSTFSDDHMCRLYEKFVLEYYKKHHPEFNACAKQIDWDIIPDESDNMLPILQTDIYLTLADRTLIIDTKYYSHNTQKNFNKRTVHSHNLYQILTYVSNEDRGRHKTDGMLLYAKTQEEIQPDGKMRLREGNTIYFKNLDLYQDFDGITAQLENLIKL